MKKLVGFALLAAFMIGCSSEPKYVQPTAKGTKVAPAALAPGQQKSNVAPMAKD